MGVKSSYKSQTSCYRFKRLDGVYRVGEEDSPAVANELVEVNGTLGGLSLEVRGSRAQTEGSTLFSGHCDMR
jgi:hypothetical protein